MTIIGGMVYKKYMVFKVFGVYLSEFLIYLHDIFFGSKILPSSCDKHQNLNYGWSCYPAGLSLKRDPLDRDRAEDRAKRPGAIL